MSNSLYSSCNSLLSQDDNQPSSSFSSQRFLYEQNMFNFFQNENSMLFNPLAQFPLVLTSFPMLPNAIEFMRSLNQPIENKDIFCDTVAVPSSTIAAQLVGKNGSKIKQISSKYRIRITSPKPNAEPVFVLDGNRARVYEAKQEILKCAAIFQQIGILKQNQIEACKRQPSMKLFVPDRFIGGIIGKKAINICKLSKEFGVFIETPNYEQRRHFTIYGEESAILRVLKQIHQDLISKNDVKFSQVFSRDREIHLLE